MGSADFPNDLPIRTVQASDGSLLFVVGGYQEEVLAVEGRGGGVSLMDDVVGDPGLPKNLSFHGKSCGMGGAGVQKIDVEAPSVAGERSGCMGALFVQLHESALVDTSRPKALARLPVQTKDALCLLLLVGGGQDDPVAHNDRRTVATPLNFSLP